MRGTISCEYKDSEYSEYKYTNGHFYMEISKCITTWLPFYIKLLYAKRVHYDSTCILNAELGLIHEATREFLKLKRSLSLFLMKFSLHYCLIIIKNKQNKRRENA